MGTCANIIRPKDNERTTSKFYTYPRHCTLKIKSKEAPSEDQLEFILTEPIHLRLDPIIIQDSEIIATQCILPGIDPRGEFYKKCQDLCLILNNETSVFLALFDGHGTEGSSVVNFCSLYAERYFSLY